MGDGEAVFNEMVNNLEVMGVNKQEPYMLTHIINAAYDMTIRLGYEFNIPVVQRILMDDCKGEQKFIKAAKSIFDPWRTEEEQNRILWEAIYWVALQNNPNLDNVKFWEESWRYTEELAKKRTKKK
jgi:hypothetical protein